MKAAMKKAKASQPKCGMGRGAGIVHHARKVYRMDRTSATTRQIMTQGMVDLLFRL
jgi:hypothetical protein